MVSMMVYLKYMNIYLKYINQSNRNTPVGKWVGVLDGCIVGVDVGTKEHDTRYILNTYMLIINYIVYTNQKV